MTSDLSGLAELSGSLVEAAGELAPHLTKRARRLGERLASGRFHVAILGEFKRGKSTLVNALLGSEILPMGVVPVTAIQTEVRTGPLGARVHFLDTAEVPIDIGELADYVTESGNPGNEHKVERVDVTAPATLLESGLVLVDTPGIGSIHGHNTDAAYAALLDADGAIVVLAADAPLSEAERELLRSLTRRDARVFIIVNKIDHLRGDELAEVRRFIQDSVARELGRDTEVWCVAARRALDVVTRGETPSTDCGEFLAFQSALARFVEEDLAGERIASARRELAALGRELEEAIAVRDAMLAFDVDTLAQRVADFRAAAREQQDLAADEQMLLARDTTQLAKEAGERLFAFARSAPRPHEQALAEASRTIPRARLDEELRHLVERWVRDDFETFRRAEADRVANAWLQLATRFRARTEDRVNAVRSAATDLFEIDLPAIYIPDIEEEREQFFYLFLQVASLNEELGRLGKRLLPDRIVRKRAHRGARALLWQEFDKHAGRARWDIAQRLEAVRVRFEQAMATELRLTVTNFLNAACEAEAAQGAAVERREQTARREEHALAVARRAKHLAVSDRQYANTPEPAAPAPSIQTGPLG